MSKKSLLFALCAPLLCFGCPAEAGPDDGPTVQDDDDDSGEDGSTSDDPSGTSEAPTTTGAEATTEPAETDTEPPTEETESGEDDTGPELTTMGFLGDMGPGGAVFECSLWDQDCDPGEKCMPYASDGGNSWNATKCTPLDATPGVPGDGCTVEGSGVSGVDTCQASSMCWNVDGETNEGTCVGFCAGSEASPVCENPSTTCSITNDGALILCLPNCDPLLQDCADGEGCYGILEGYVCAPDASGEMGAYGDPCEAINVCDAGHECMPAAAVPDCAGSVGCCTPFCDTTEASNCPGGAGGQECVAAFEAGNAPPGYEDLGVCGIPV